MEVEEVDEEVDVDSEVVEEVEEEGSGQEPTPWAVAVRAEDTLADGKSAVLTNPFRSHFPLYMTRL
jgi:hypothetical protein